MLLGHGSGEVEISFVRTRVAIRMPGLDPGFTMRKPNRLHTLFQPLSVKTSLATKPLLTPSSPSLPPGTGLGCIVSHPSWRKPSHWSRVGGKWCSQISSHEGGIIGEILISSGACPWNRVLLDHFRSFTLVLNLQQPPTPEAFESIHRTESSHLSITILLRVWFSDNWFLPL